MSGWQPIETAPRNGKPVDLGMQYRNARGEQFFRAPDCYWHKGKRGWVGKWFHKDGFSSIRAPFEPTHWMPRPEAPTPNKEA